MQAFLKINEHTKKNVWLSETKAARCLWIQYSHEVIYRGVQFSPTATNLPSLSAKQRCYCAVLYFPFSSADSLFFQELFSKSPPQLRPTLGHNSLRLKIAPCEVTRCGRHSERTTVHKLEIMVVGFCADCVFILQADVQRSGGKLWGRVEKREWAKMSFHCGYESRLWQRQRWVKIHDCHGGNRNVTPAAHCSPWALKGTVPPMGQNRQEHFIVPRQDQFWLHIPHWV